MAGKAAVLNIDVVANVQSAVTAFETLRSKSESGFSVLKVAGVAAAGAVMAELGAATKAAMEQEAELAKLSTAYKNAGLDASQAAKGMDAVEATTRRTGQSSGEAVAGFTKLITAVGNQEEALRLLAVAEDLAAFKGTSVESAAVAVAKAAQGNTKALAGMGIATTDAAGNALSATEVMDRLTDAVKGQANAYGDTAAGKMARYKESLEQTQETIGAAVLPALSKLLDLLAPMFDWLAQNQAVLNTLVPILAALAGVVLTVTAATKVYTAVQTVLNVVLAANPIGLVVVAIAALVAGVVIAYQKVGWFRDAVDAVWGALKAVGAWIMDNWRLIVGAMLGPIGLIVLNFDKVKAAIGAVVDVLLKVKDAASNAFGWLGKVGSWVGKIPGLGGLLGGGKSADGLGAAPVVMVLNIAPGDAYPETVYRALRDYQRRHARPELAAIFGV